MLLCAYIINSTPVSELDTVAASDLDGNAAFVVANELPAGYQDISSIENWARYGPELIGSAVGFKDWKCLQREIGLLAEVIVAGNYDTGWNNLNAAQKVIVCNYLLSRVPPVKFAQTIPSADERTRISIDFDLNNRRARGNWQTGSGRIQAMRIYLFGKIGKTNALAVLKDVVDDGLLELYEGGVEGTVEDGLTGLNDFLLARAGTVYEDSGLAGRQYPVLDGSGDTMSDVAGALAEISSDGMY